MTEDIPLARIFVKQILSDITHNILTKFSLFFWNLLKILILKQFFDGLLLDLFSLCLHWLIGVHDELGAWKLFLEDFSGVVERVEVSVIHVAGSSTEALSQRGGGWSSRGVLLNGRHDAGPPILGLQAGIT